MDLIIKVYLIGILWFVLTMRFFRKVKIYVTLGFLGFLFTIQNLLIYNFIAAQTVQTITVYEEIKVESDVYEIASEVYDVDIYLLKAIETLETGHYTSDLYLEKNNTWGCVRDGEFTAFDSVDQSTMELARTLHTYYEDMSIEEISKKFCPDNASEWSEVVSDIYKELKYENINT